jgi:preprotein translocase subunit SecA
MKKFLSDIKLEFSNLHIKTDEELETQIFKLKKRSEYDPLEKFLPEWFAMVQEISLRKIGLKHFDTQLLAGIHLHQGKIVEMKTGEGKTLASTLPVSFNALLKKGVHVVTVNDYLAERDQKWMGKVYKGLGLSIGLVKSTSSSFEKRESYGCDITYVTNSELVFDFLRDSSAYNLNEVVQRSFDYCVIDEIDSILIDEARTPLILSTFKGNVDANKLNLAKTLADCLEKIVHFEVDEKRKEINLTEEGYKEAQKRLGKKNLYDPEDPWILEILNALKAKYIFKLNKDYIVLNNKILIVDEFTGRVMEDRRWSFGIHEAIEAKEKVEIGGGTKTKSSITYQNFFPLYRKLAGMTGTAKTAEKEFQDIYNLKVVVLPTAKPMIRKDLSDFVYQTELGKWKAVLTKSKECYSKGQPILIGTASVEKSEFLSELFRISKLPHQVLNAKPENVTRESEIIAQAGEAYAITIATNMAGRGTDIILGGNPLFIVKQKLSDLLLENFDDPENMEVMALRAIARKKEKEEQTETGKDTDGKEEKFLFVLNSIKEEYGNLEELKKDIENLPYSLETSKEKFKDFYQFLFNEVSKDWKKENEKVKSLGGLFVLGTERHETRRIDNQLRGRAGRQGDPGTSQFYVSLDDELIKLFGGDSIKRWVEYLIQDEETPLESKLLTNSLENAQKKVELYNYDLRKNVFQYDEILNIQRNVIFQARKQILCENISQDFFLRYRESFFDEECGEKVEKKKFLFKNEKWLDSYSTYFIDSKTKKERSGLSFREYRRATTKFSNTNSFWNEIWISNDLQFSQANLYQENFFKITRSILILNILDYYWTEHIERMSYIRETINWRSYGQQNPLTEYNLEAFESFKLMLNEIRSSMIYYFLNNPLLDIK